MTDEQRRLTYLRENVEHLEREKSELESLLLTLQRASETDVAEVMRALRMSNDLHTIARDVHAGRMLSKARAASSPQEAGRNACEHDACARTGLEHLLRLDVPPRSERPDDAALFDAARTIPEPYPQHCVGATFGAQ